MKTAIPAYRFSSSATAEPPDILGEMTPEDFLKLKYQRGCSFGLDELHQSGHYKLAGWSFNFHKFLKRFVVNQHGHWFTRYAPNKTMLRNSMYGTIHEIIPAP